MITDEQINSIVSRLSSKFPIEDIYLFGSHARKEENSDSDIDLCFTTRLGNRRKIDMMRDIRREINKTVNLPVDILVYDVEEFQQRSSHPNTLEHKILRDGTLLNE